MGMDMDIDLNMYMNVDMAMNMKSNCFMALKPRLTVDQINCFIASESRIQMFDGFIASKFMSYNQAVA